MVAIPIVNQWGSQPAGHAYEVPGRALTRRANSRTAVNGSPTGVTYVDNRLQFGAKHILEPEIAAFTADARAAFGDTAVNAEKTVLSTSFDTIGWRFNTIEGTVAPSPRVVLKLIYVFNVATPPDAKAPGQGSTDTRFCLHFDKWTHCFQKQYIVMYYFCAK